MGRIWRLAVFLFVVGFVLNLVGIVSHVVVSSFARRWFSTPLPGGFTAARYAYSWREVQLDQVLTVTLVVAASVTALALGRGFTGPRASASFAASSVRWRCPACSPPGSWCSSPRSRTPS